jgi:hypothetical protein
MDRLSFFERSANVRPGMGPGERTICDYGELARVSGWRRMLCDAHIELFSYEGATYESIGAAKVICGDEHYAAIRAAKFTQTSSRHVLLWTKNAELWRVSTGKSAVRDEGLERLRDWLRAGM